MTESVMPTYGRLDITFAKGEGAWLTDTRGERYLDALSGIAVCGLGHCHPAVTRAITEQAATLVHTSNIYHIEKQEKLADKLTQLSGMEQVFFCNSGAEANEAAIKLARKYGRSRGVERPVIIVMDGSFHGRTMATLTATANQKVKAGFEPLLPGFVRVPFNDIDAVRLAVNHWPEAVAVLVEPVQGEGGIRVPDSEYLASLRELCTQHKLLMMLDEIQTGMGRTGKWFAFQQKAGVLPDVMSLAKGLGNGMPIGACLVSGLAVGVLGTGSHGSTFGGNPLACNTALAVLEVIEQQNLLDHVNRLGEQMYQKFKQQLSQTEGVKEVRHLGFMYGIELTVPCTELVKLALAENILINVTADKVIRLLPPLILSAEEAELIVTKVCHLIKTFLATHHVTEDTI